MWTQKQVEQAMDDAVAQCADPLLRAAARPPIMVPGFERQDGSMQIAIPIAEGSYGHVYQGEQG